MFIKSQKYTICVSEYADRHYIKTFSKKFKGKKWITTMDAICSSLVRIANLVASSKINIISEPNESYSLCKFDFSIAGTNISPKTSGNRVILVANNETLEIHILLVYSKNEICSPNETRQWKEIIKKEFPEYAAIFPLD